MRLAVFIVALVSVITASSLRAEDLITPVEAGQIDFLSTVKRKTYSEALQAKFLNDRLDYFVSVSGPSFRFLQITSQSMDKAAADQMRNNTTNITTLKELGFVAIQLSNGQGQSWSMTLK